MVGIEVDCGTTKIRILKDINLGRPWGQLVFEGVEFGAFKIYHIARTRYSEYSVAFFGPAPQDLVNKDTYPCTCWILSHTIH